ncbi:type VI secretion system baseplate subunit TssE [Hahella sp. SMD15-11]|uniref:Type VI secretion system baseplate subunit TssE n=1 Tax=Thermohahella caldifontis TaxID=3142973 RepID=A0AB39UZT1_9GAMM
MASIGFLDRVVLGERHPRGVAPEQEVAGAVMANIGRMLQIRAGSYHFLPDFGVPDFNDLVFEFPDAIYRIGHAIRAFLLNYENRLADVDVVYMPDPEQPLQLKFRIEARLSPDLGGYPLAFYTVMTSNGRAFLER